MSETPIWGIPYVPENTTDPAAGLNLALNVIDSKLQEPVDTHAAAPDPHPQYTTADEAAAAAPVQSVQGRTGAVVVTKADLALDNVDNTSDANKQVSGPQQAALNLKIDLAAIADNLITNDPARPLSANQGVQIKALIDNIETLLNSDNINLDTLQEIVDFIELNRATLDTLGIGNIAGLQAALDSKVDKITGKGLSTEDFTTAEKTKLGGIAAGAQVNVATNLAQGTRTATTVPVTSSTGTAATLGAATAALAGVMTAAQFTKLGGIATAATANASDAELRDRATHTGVQATSTINGLDTILAALAAATNDLDTITTYGAYRA